MKNGLSPQYMSEHFIHQECVHTYYTNKGAFVITKVKNTLS